MEEETIDRIKYPFQAHSALYHAVKGLIFMRGNFAYQVSTVLKDTNDRNLRICNEERIKERLFGEILKRYNKRIEEYELKLEKILESQKRNVDLVRFRLVESVGEEEEDYSGNYVIFPRVFVCEKCGDFKEKKSKELRTFDPRKCETNNCDGEYEQVSIVMFCKECGNIEPLRYTCRNHGSISITLRRRQKDSLGTWEVVCRKCQEKGIREPIDIFRFECKHFDRNGEKISNRKETKFKPLTIKEGGVYTPVVVTLVDIPQSENIDLENLEYILLGLHLGKFSKISERINRDVGIAQIKDLINYFKNETARNIFLQRFSGNVTYEEKDIQWKKETCMDVIEEVVEKLKDECSSIDLKNFNDFHAILNTESTNFDEQNKMLKSRYGIQNIEYLPSINLVGSCIGIINGVNRFYEDGFVPHFSPIFDSSKEKDKIIIYAYPFETEGILIDLDKIKTCGWLYQNGLIERMPEDVSKATETLLQIEENSEAHKALKTLLHTLSHILIRRSSLYTGLDSNSCGELIFVNPAAILIYSTSIVNIGGFEFVFEHSLKEWFRDVEIEATECTFDPACITERGACFSCLYLPEHVCTEFNQYLDRGVLVGRRRYNVGFWQYVKQIAY